MEINKDTQSSNNDNDKNDSHEKQEEPSQFELIIPEKSDNQECYNEEPGYCFREGNTYCLIIPFLSKKDPFIVIGPDYLYIIIFYSILLTISLLTSIYIHPHLVIGFSYINNFIFYLLLVSYTITSLVNPGIWVSNSKNISQIDLNQSYYKCNVCQYYISKSTQSKHCSYCNVCVERHDHHCPWSGKCIGKNNQSSFYVFTISTFCYYMFSAVSVLIYFSTLIDKKSVFRRNL